MVIRDVFCLSILLFSDCLLILLLREHIPIRCRLQFTLTLEIVVQVRQVLRDELIVSLIFDYLTIEAAHQDG